MICKICQSRGTPIIGERKYGTNLDKTKNFEYCSLCYTDGRLLRNVILTSQNYRNLKEKFKKFEGKRVGAVLEFSEQLVFL